MGGAAPSYIRPVQPTNGRISTFWAHQHRTTPSKEPGVDYYCPIGTPLVSIGDGKVLAVGGGIGPATGRFIWVGLDNGQSFRLLHLKSWLKKAGDRVRMGEVIAISGASGYGSEFFGFASVDQIPASYGGPHTHATLFPAWSLNFAATLDLELYVDRTATPAAGESKPFNPLKEDDMTGEPFHILHNGALFLANGRALGGIVHLIPTSLDLLTGGTQSAGYWNLKLNGKDAGPLDPGTPLFDTRDNQVAFDELLRIYQQPNTPAPTVAVDLDEDAIAVRILDGLSPAAIADAILTEGVAAAVADELAKRLAG